MDQPVGRSIEPEHDLVVMVWGPILVGTLRTWARECLPGTTPRARRAARASLLPLLLLVLLAPPSSCVVCRVGRVCHTRAIVEQAV